MIDGGVQTVAGVAEVIRIYQERVKELRVATRSADDEEDAPRIGRVDLMHQEKATYPVSKRVAQALVCDSRERLAIERARLRRAMRRCLTDGELSETAKEEETKWDE